MAHNLALLPRAERDAIEQDKQRWMKARRIYMTWDHRAIRQWLADIADDDDREDWRRRLNAVRLRLQSRSKK